ncbi:MULTISPECIES: hypothetical protein [Methylobacterium]|uniref:hypothetical protein n=1 Tax=Methylobacterium TaxID=407 RepID=UPI0013EC6E57|nr:hypothetical protein [Methylobacterium sp. DB0501]NGM37946.1 hypothetical protein [Methylobacterium sp. DB0501]
MARIIRKETRKRGFFGKLFKGAFIGFNLLMTLWLVGYLIDVIPKIEQSASSAAKTGGQIGVLFGVGLLCVFWIAGALILGLFTMMTRGSVTVIEERVE